MRVIVLSCVFLFSSIAGANNYIVARLAPTKNVVVRSEVSGIVNSYTYENGDDVRQGEGLLSLSAKDYSLNVDLSKYEMDVSTSELEAQEKQLKRYQSLFNKKGVSASDLENQLRVTNISRAQLNVNKTKYKIAQRTLGKSTPDAPFDGVVIDRGIELGQFVSVGDPLYTIADMSQLKIRFHLLEMDFNKFKKGDTLKVTIPSTGKSYTGIVSVLSPAIRESEPGFVVEVTLDNHDAELNPGLASHVYFGERDAE